ncbi:MAG: transporter [Gemmatimonadaceae bacterium]
MERLALALATVVTLAPGSVAHSQGAPDGGARRSPPPIQDNSFLIEEAYNQEAGVVQHISTFETSRGAWAYGFTQEWPLGGQRHQLSFTVPVLNAEHEGDSRTGIGDLLVNYRLQLGNGEGSRLAVAPRLSLLLPTGDERRQFGAGALGIQANLPVSFVLTPVLVTHVNAGATIVPSSRSAIGEKASTTAYTLGQSLIWLARPTFNVMLELLHVSSEDVVGPGRTERNSSTVISPGVRGAINFASGLQVVPGIAVPIEVGSGDDEQRVFFYLSFEHAFKR